MPICHDGHDRDTEPAPECPGCCEIIRAPEAHVCKPIGWIEPVALAPGVAAWIDSWQLIGDPPEVYAPLPLRPDHQEPA